MDYAPLKGLKSQQLNRMPPPFNPLVAAKCLDNTLWHLVAMMHECNLGKKELTGLHPYLIPTKQGFFSQEASVWCTNTMLVSNAPGLHRCIMIANGHQTLKHRAVLKRLAVEPAAFPRYGRPL